MGNVSKELKTLRNNQKEMLEIKSTIKDLGVQPMLQQVLSMSRSWVPPAAPNTNSKTLTGMKNVLVTCAWPREKNQQA